MTSQVNTYPSKTSFFLQEYPFTVEYVQALLENFSRLPGSWSFFSYSPLKLIHLRWKQGLGNEFSWAESLNTIFVTYQITWFLNYLKVALKEQHDMVDKIFLVEATTTHKAVSPFHCNHCHISIYFFLQKPKPLMWERLKFTERFKFVNTTKVRSSQISYSHYKKKLHRRNVTSHHSFTLLWQF